MNWSHWDRGPIDSGTDTGLAGRDQSRPLSHSFLKWNMLYMKQAKHATLCSRMLLSLVSNVWMDDGWNWKTRWNNSICGLGEEVCVNTAQRDKPQEWSRNGKRQKNKSGVPLETIRRQRWGTGIVQRMPGVPWEHLVGEKAKTGLRLSHRNWQKNQKASTAHLCSVFSSQMKRAPFIFLLKKKKKKI